MMPVIVTGERGVPLMCETCGQPGTGVWSGGWDGKSHVVCAVHNPMANTAMALPPNFTSRPVCPLCGR